MTAETQIATPGNGVLPRAPGTLATAPGTDFKPVAIGTGANVEGLPAYFTDPLLQTGNMPGVAISAFNNRALRQGTFVASSLCLWISGQINQYIPDDGNQINWISEWQNALSAFVEALIPAGPDLGAYLPLAGGTMVGNIQFQTGISTILANNTWYYGRDTTGQQRGLIIKGADNNVTVNDGSSPYVIIANTPVANNNFSWSGTTSTGTIRPVIGLLSDNNIHIGSNATTDIYFDESNAVHHAGNFILNNNRYVMGNDSGGTARQMLGINAANALMIGNGVTSETDIYAGGGQPINLRVNTNAYGQLTVYGYTYINAGGRVYIPGGNDPLQVLADNGYYARAHFVTSGVRDWSVGCYTNGPFGIADESAHAVRWQIDTSGNITTFGSQTVNGNMTVGGNFQCNNSINASANLSCSNTLFVYNQAQVWNSLLIQTGALYVQNGGISAAGGITGNGLTDNGSTQVNGNLNCNNNINCNTFGTNHIQDNGDCSVGGTVACSSVSASNHISVSSGFCMGSGGPYNFDYTLGFPVANHAQWASGLGVYAQFFGSYCDERLKRNVQAVDHDALAGIKALKFYSFDSPRNTPNGEVIDDRSHAALGFLAQQVQESLPEAVHETDIPVTFVEDHTQLADGGAAACHFDTQTALAIDMTTLLACSLRAIQQLTARIEQLEGRA